MPKCQGYLRRCLLRSRQSCLQCHLLYWHFLGDSHWLQGGSSILTLKKTSRAPWFQWLINPCLEVSLSSWQTPLQKATWEYFPSNCYHLNSRSPSSKRESSDLYNLVQMVNFCQVTRLIMSRLKNRQTSDTKLTVSGIFFC